MFNDQKLLGAIGFVLAIAVSAAVSRGVITPGPARNPLQSWPNNRCRIAFFIALTAAAVTIGAIVWSDAWPKKLPHKSATLEWVYSPAEAATIVQRYDDCHQRGQAVRGVLLDSFAFIPSYVLLIAIASFWTARTFPVAPWSNALLIAGWSAFIAGAFDYLENAGIFLALGHVTTRVAPMTYAACQIKWLIALTAASFTIIAAVCRLACTALRHP